MVLLNCDEFLKQLTAMIVADADNAPKTVRISYKRHIPNKKTWKNGKSSNMDSSMLEQEPVCLVRARLGDCKISTHVTVHQFDKFSNSINQISELLCLQEEELET
ncbi:Signal recognition particle 14kD family protein [Babesia bovis T2Bo]|uniref:Signal recognition particle 14kD family protein n=1 Tax=Babesia bovis T2Bo TaxID=484906 RepID=UPI001E1356C8|nr:Signal recognition particle 14kD family protein [Babesia bovis T2Bo]KAG6439918.1 Signal recognition particle 14kD family protein [Babesia bovis T2Bo]